MVQNRETFNEKPVYTLTEILKSIETVITRTYPHPYYIKAEIVKLNYYPHSGHCYPELVEKEGAKIKTQMRAIIWSSQFRDINERFTRITGEPMKEGISILCLATIEFDVKYGLSLHIQDVEPTYTVGELIRNKTMVIDRLKKEKIFTSNKEREWPLLPKRIAVISVETSKGYGDFMVTLQNNPYQYKFECTLYPSILQGDKAITTITARLEEIKTQLHRYDCVVIIRGGGGDVGLTCYDDYELASAVATFPLPVIAGIGHSTNITVTDMVAFQSKITPTDVANFLIEKFRDFDKRIEEYKGFIGSYGFNLIRNAGLQLAASQQTRDHIALKIITAEKHKLQQLESNRKYITGKLLHDRFSEIKQIKERLKFACTGILSAQKEQLRSHHKMTLYLSKQLLDKNNREIAAMESKISLLHPDNILKRGYSITFFNRKAVSDKNDLKPGNKIVTKFYNGEIESIVE